MVIRATTSCVHRAMLSAIDGLRSQRSKEPSRPMPRSFMPKEAIVVEMVPSLIPTTPYSSASAMR